MSPLAFIRFLLGPPAPPRGGQQRHPTCVVPPPVSSKPVPPMRPDVRLMHQMEGDRGTIRRYRRGVPEVTP